MNSGCCPMSLQRRLQRWWAPPPTVTRIPESADRLSAGAASSRRRRRHCGRRNIRRHTRANDTVTLLVPPTRRSTLGDRAFPVAAARAWNALPARVRSEPSLSILYRLMLLGRAAPVVNARLLLTEANVVSEDCGRGRGPSHTTVVLRFGGFL